MKAILTWIENLLTAALFPCATFEPDRSTSESLLVSDTTWFRVHDEIQIGDAEVRQIQTINHDDKVITLTDSLSEVYECPTVVKRYWTNDPQIILGDHAGPFGTIPIIQIQAGTDDIEPLTIGSNAWIHSILIDILIEKDNNRDAYLEMVDVAHLIYSILLQYRTVYGCGRWLYDCRPQITYGDVEHKSSTLTGAGITFTMHEEGYVYRPRETDALDTTVSPFAPAYSDTCDTVVNVDMLYQITASDCSVFCDASENGAFSVLLPPAHLARDHPFLIKKSDSDSSANVITIVPHEDDKIENQDSYALENQGDKVVLIYIGGACESLPPAQNWEIVEQPIHFVSY